ncbi:DUF805 domain-containing protein [Brevundimonas sp. NIBR11]|uniref:DUF805 domain-containing protein n=1 Tax=Brevundimonas sp. NIBR11 TaxID=3015999 RepID=UPI0022EFE074|nr:DUF805 domain-containing protein [Brevundimonas sp. NIBR11]WGM30265.1 hypothetical protein KKHFBJBL_00481 [Brevundimonas sp. NIBR11]
MRGQILSFDDASGAGLISGDDGIRYTFGREAVSPPAAVSAGLRVDFVPVAGEATNIMLLAAAPAPPAPSPTPGVPVDGFDFKTALFSFQGRMRRSHFWIGWLICLGIGVVAGWIPFLGPLVSLALIWPNLAITVKRLHDMGQTGWLAAIPFVAGMVALVAIFVSVGAALMTNYTAIENEDPAAIMALIGPSLGILGIICLLQLGFLLWIGISESQRGDNRFGANPKGE